LPNNFVTVFRALTTDLGIETPWPKPEGYVPDNADHAILIWGGSSSVGQFAIQILRYYGYTNVLATASSKHHDKLCGLGAKEVFDYNKSDVVASIRRAGGDAVIPLIFDCIGSKNGSIAPISKIAKAGTKVAILLPVVVRDSSDTEDPEYEMDVKGVTDWEEGVDARGVRTHFYIEVSTDDTLQIPGWLLLTIRRMSSSSTICSLISCPRCSKKVLSLRRGRRLLRAQRCSRGGKMR
jgi:hypothetical protein